MPKIRLAKGVVGGGEEKTAPIVKTTKIAVKPNYDAWGELAPQAQAQGWHPTFSPSGELEFRNNYSNQFNQVVIPNQQQRGYISVVGRKGSPLSVFIKRADGTVDRELLHNVSPQQVDAYFRSQGGTIQRRTDAIAAGTNSDRIMPNGTYTPLQ